MNKIPRTFCVTLKETPERREEAEKHFKELNLDVEFFEGIHGETFGVSSNIPNFEEIPGREYHITPGHAGCILSHFTLWKTLQNLSDDVFFITEDDARFETGFQSKFLEYTKELPDDWQFVYIGHVPVDGEVPKMISDHIGIYKPYGTHAYMVKKSALSVLIETNKVLWYHIDMQIRSRSLPLLKNYTIIPSLVSQKSVYNFEEPLWHSLCYDWEEDPHKIRKEESSKDLYFGKGWHPLERNAQGHFIWSDGRGELVINGDWKTLEVEVLAEAGVEKSPCKVISPKKMDTNLFFQEGKNKIFLDLTDKKSLIFETRTFNPAKEFKSCDTRELGLRFLNGFTLTAQDGSKHFVPLSNMEKGDRIIGKTRIDDHENFRYSPSVSNPDGKINMRNQLSFAHHRSGWNYAIKLLSNEHKDDGVKFDGFLDSTFGTSREQNMRIRNIPYRENWIGVFHNPPMASPLFTDVGNPISMILCKPFIESLSMCKGIYVLSEYHAKFLKELIPNVLVEVLYHPTEPSDEKFTMDRFSNNIDKKVVNIGWWQRRITSIFRLKVNDKKYKKFRILPSSANQSNLTIDRVLKAERGCLYPTSDEEMQSVTTIRHLPISEYDTLLSENLVFVDLYDASANNVVIECMVRNTPILINRLPAVEEYLGEDYPFYFSNLEEASSKINDESLVEETHKYLCNWWGTSKVSAEYFMSSFKNGKIYNSL